LAKQVIVGAKLHQQKRRFMSNNLFISDQEVAA
jgi:hypothetical protein